MQVPCDPSYTKFNVYMNEPIPINEVKDKQTTERHSLYYLCVDFNKKLIVYGPGLEHFVYDGNGVRKVQFICGNYIW